MTRRLQILRLMRQHGLSFTQAALIASLHFGEAAQ